MSTEDLDYDPSIILTVVEDPPQRRRYLLAAAIVAALLVGLVTVVAVVVRIKTIVEKRNAVVPAAAQRDPAEERAEAARIFSAYDALGITSAILSSEERAERDAIIALINDIEAAVEAEDFDAFRTHFDADRFLTRIALTGSLAGYSSFDKRTLRGQAKTLVEPDAWAGLVVVGVVSPPDDPDSRIVYAYGADDPYDTPPYRFWIARTDGVWKIYDWEELELGLSESQRWGVHCRYAGSPAMTGYQRWVQLVEEADSLTESGDRDAALEKLRLAELEMTPPELGDYVLLLTGYRWANRGEHAAAQACYDQIEQPDDVPGIYESRMSMLASGDAAAAAEYAERYAAAVGPNPAMLRGRARLLTRLHRDNEAARTWQMLLRMQPADADALETWFLKLPAGGRTAFREHISRLDDPLAAVEEIAPGVASSDYPAMLELVDIARQVKPDEPGLQYLAGVAKTADGRRSEAAELYWQAFSRATDETKRSEYFNAYRDEMAHLGKVVEAMEKAPDFEEAAEALLYAYDDGDVELTTAEYHAIVAALAARFPNNLDALDRKIAIAVDDERYADAERVARQAIATLPPRAETPALDDAANEPSAGEYDANELYRETFAGHLATALYRLGRWREAYETSSDRRAAFDSLTNLADKDKRWDLLRELLALHRSGDADDSRILIVEGDVAAHESRWDDALQHYLAAAVRADAESAALPWDVQRRAVIASIKANRILDFYQQQQDAKKAFTLIAGELERTENWDALRSLHAAHRVRMPDHLQLLTSEANMAWARREYGRYIAAADRVTTSPDDGSLAPYERLAIEDRRFLALLHAGDYNRAQADAQRTMDQVNDASELAIVAAVTGDFAAATTHALAASDAAPQGPLALYQTEDFGALFLATEFRAVHRMAPVTPSYEMVATSAVLLLQQPLAVERDAVAVIVRNLAEDAQAVLPSPGIDDASPLAPATLVVQLDGASVWLQWGQGAYRGDYKLGPGAPLRLAATSSRGWLAVGVAGWSESARERAAPLARALACKLVGEAATVLYIAPPGGPMLLFAYPAAPNLLDAWKADGKLHAFQADRIILQWDDGVQTVDRDRAFDQALWDAVHVHEAVPGAGLQVWMRPGQRNVETLKLDVTQIRRRYGLEIDGLLTADSLLIPQLREGLPMRVYLHQIEGFQLDRGEPLLRD